MTRVTRASLAYVATQVPVSFTAPFVILTVPQVRFSLSSAPIFSRTDTVTDSEGFYTSVLALLDDPDEAEEEMNLLAWWDRSVE
jgi:hypothetical protein